MISSLPEEQAAVDADGPEERLRRCQDPSEEELPPTLPAGVEHHDFGITAVWVEGEGGGSGTKMGEGRGSVLEEGWCISV